jgi:mono/diheme cytochrome c family protein
VRTLLRSIPLAAAAAVAAVSLGGCGTGGLPQGQGNTRTGGELFTAKCGGCHKLAAANTQGTIGPDLDAAFGSDRQQGFNQDTIESVVFIQMQQPSPPMPDDSELFKTCEKPNVPQGCVDNREEALESVARYVSETAGLNGPEPKPTGTKSTDGKEIFSTNCASCHTLAAAGATGTIGPNLDQLKPSFEVTKHQVEVGGGVMPAFKGKLTDQQIDAVAKYVSDNAGK